MKRLGKFSKLIITILVILTIQMVFTNQVKAKDASKVGINDVLDAGGKWIGGAKEIDNTTPEDFAKQFIGIGQVLVAIGIVTLLIVGIIMALKWITASPDKQAVLKQQLIGLVAATVVIFGAIGIWNLIRGIGQNVEDKMEPKSENAPYSYHASALTKL